MFVLRKKKLRVARRYFKAIGGNTSKIVTHQPAGIDSVPPGFIMLPALLLACSAAHVCTKADAARRVPSAPGWKFDLKGCKQLYLAHADLGPGVEALADAMSRNTELTHLNLYNNSIGDDGAHRLGDVLADNDVLTTLFLERNGISDAAIEDFAIKLERNTAIQTLGLFGNELGAKARQALRTAGFVGLDWADGEYKRNLEKRLPAVAAEAVAQLQPGAAWSEAPSASQPARLQLSSSTQRSWPYPPPPLSPPPPPPPPPPIPAACLAMCGHASCDALRTIGLICDDTRLVCGDGCAQCCDQLPPPAPFPSSPPRAPCLDRVSDCADDENSICHGVPTLARKICPATCGVCETYGSQPGVHGWWWAVAGPEAVARPSAAGAQNVGMGVSAGLVFLGIAGGLAVCARTASRTSQQECLH